MKNLLMLPAFLALGFILPAGCEKKTPDQKTQDRIDDALDRRPNEKIRDAAEDIRDDAKDAAKKTAEIAKEAAEKAKEKTKEAVDATKEAVKDAADAVKDAVKDDSNADGEPAK